MTVTILGGCGFIGINLVKSLLEQNSKIIIYGRGEIPNDLHGKVLHIRGDFNNFDMLKAAVDGSEFVYHLIGSTPHLAQKDRFFDVKHIIEPTLRLLDLGISGAFKKIIFVSSGGTVYGPQSQVPIHEDSPQWPISSYGVSKVAIEKYLHMYAHAYGLDYKVARLSNPFGEYQYIGKGQGVISTLIECALKDKQFQMVGDGSVIRDYIYISDVINALKKLSLHNGYDRVFNIGSGVGRSILEIVNIVESVTNTKIKINKFPPRNFDVPVNVLDINRAINQLDWEPVSSIEDSINRTARWFKSFNF